MKSPTDWYEQRARELAERYRNADPDHINHWLRNLLPSPPAHVLDVGTGSGRDAAWFASHGHKVLAVEPSPTMRAQAQRWNAHPNVEYQADRLPELAFVLRSGISFDFILLNAVWMHVAPADRPRAFRKLISTRRPGGIIALTLRDPIDAERGMHPVSADEIEQLTHAHGGFIEKHLTDTDALGRGDIHWTKIALRLPDDGTGALPLLRRIVLSDNKSSTYKLALLRVLCRIADGAAGLASEGTEQFARQKPAWEVADASAGWDTGRNAGRNDSHVDLPLGLVALYWIRLFKPLLAEGLPQTPNNRGIEGLGFVKDGGFRRLMSVSPLDLRAGMRFSGEHARALYRALRDAAETITRMPARYLTLKDGTPIFPTERTRASPVKSMAEFRLDAAALWSFGRFSVPRQLWQTLKRYNTWVEPAVVSEWARLMQQYAQSQGYTLSPEKLAQAMTWLDPERTVRTARERALRVMESGGLHCVWSGARLRENNIDIDHCFPWSAWQCGDLWNLMPTRRQVNQRLKRELLPSGAAIRGAKERIIDWWGEGYLRGDGRNLSERFATEAAASLPTLIEPTQDLEDIFSAMNLQRLRLSSDQQILEWEGID